MAHPSDKNYEHKESLCRYLPGIARQPSKVSPTYKTLKQLLDLHALTPEFLEAHRIDQVDIPTAVTRDGTPVLDLGRVQEQLVRHPSPLSTVLLTRSYACKVYDLGLVLAGKHPVSLDGAPIFPAAAGVPLSQGDWSKVDWRHLVGEIVPYFTQSPHAISTNAEAFQPIQSDRPHSLAFKPVVLSTASEGRGDHGEVLAQGVVISPRAFNFPQGQVRRVSLNCNPVFEETVCWVLITHAYAPNHGCGGGEPTGAVPYKGLPYVSMNKPNKPRGNKRQREAPDPWEETREATFKWRAYQAYHRDRLDQPNYRIGPFGLLTTKMTHRHVTRAIVTMPIFKVAEQLASLRRPDGPGLDQYLVQLSMTQVDKGKAHTDIGGLDLRKMLMVERLVVGTPLEPLLRGEAPSFAFPPPAVGTPSSRFFILKCMSDRWWPAPVGHV